MMRLVVRASILGILLVSLTALPAMAQTIPAGKDYWRTPNNGQTFFEFPAGDVESLCGAPVTSGWNHVVALRGVPQAGSDWDTVVTRLDNATFDATGTAFTRVQVQFLAFVSAAPHGTPCGTLTWRAKLSGAQPITRMTIRRTTNRGGVFYANLLVNVEMQATDSTGKYVGSLFYTRELPDPGTGTPWSFGATTTIFRAGMTETDNCIDVLRQKLSTIDPASSHFYWVSDMIAQGKCTRTN